MTIHQHLELLQPVSSPCPLPSLSTQKVPVSSSLWPRGQMHLHQY